jgi:hypothetical protein
MLIRVHGLRELRFNSKLHYENSKVMRWVSTSERRPAVLVFDVARRLVGRAAWGGEGVRMLVPPPTLLPARPPWVYKQVSRENAYSESFSDRKNSRD